MSDVNSDNYLQKLFIDDVKGALNAGGSGTDCEDGEDGFSPVVDITDIAGGHRVMIADASGAKSFDVMDGKNSEPILLTDVLFDVLLHVEKTDNARNGIAYTWNNNKCHISGTSTGYGFHNIYGSASELPPWLEKGKTYRVIINNFSNGVRLGILYHRDNDSANIEDIYFTNNADEYIVIPTDITGVTIRLVVSTSDITVDHDLDFGIYRNVTIGDLVSTN